MRQLRRHQICESDPTYEVQFDLRRLAAAVSDTIWHHESCRLPTESRPDNGSRRCTFAQRSGHCGLLQSLGGATVSFEHAG